MNNVKVLSSSSSLLITKSANEWINEAKSKPIPNMLFGQLWFEGEVCILYASSNVGKSILAVQIADSISSGRSVFPLKMESQPQSVLYFDFELSAKQFENRYSNNYTDHHFFDERFYRVEIDHEAEMPQSSDFNKVINDSIEAEIRRTGSKVLIVDNITYLKNETEKSKDAIPLMKHLKKLKSKYGLSILALAHSPKRDQSRPINRNDLGGSAMLMNFCDSSFAIGESNRDKSYRYVKQIKSRNCDHIYGSDNVLVYEVQKPSNFVHFHFVDNSDEYNHLVTQTYQEKEERNQRIFDLKKEEWTNVKIAKEVGLSEGAVRKILKKSND
ncbi:AAA family ATPase [Flagellimonas marina]